MPASGGLLALDLSGRTGWCYGRAKETPVGGVWALPVGKGRGALMAGLCDVLADALTVLRPSLVVVEAPLPIQAVTSAAAARHQFALADAVELICYRRSMSLREERADTVRKTIFGSARPWNKPGRKGNKEMFVVQAAQEKGFEIEDNNHADALFLWLYSTQYLTAKGSK